MPGLRSISFFAEMPRPNATGANTIVQINRPTMPHTMDAVALPSERGATPKLPYGW